MTRKIIILVTIFLAFFIVSCNNNKQTQLGDKPNSNNAFTTLDYDKVVAYSYDGEGEIEIIDDKGQLAKKIKSQVQLNRSQIRMLTNIFCEKSTYGGEVAACFDPHFGVVFYKANKPKAFVSVCLDCNYLVSSIKIPDAEGRFSHTGAKKIVEFEKDLKFL